MVTSKSPRARLLHIRDEIERVAMIVRGLSFVQYQDSYLHRRAVERRRADRFGSRESVASGLPRQISQCAVDLHCRNRQHLAA